MGFRKLSGWLPLAGAGAFVAGAVLFALAGPRLGGTEPEKPPRQAEPVPVTVEKVTPRPVQRTVRVVGTFYGHEEVTVGPKVEGRVARILHDVGDVVRPGEPLLELDDTDYRLAVAEAERSLGLELARLGLKEAPGTDFTVGHLPPVVRAELVRQNALAKLERARRLGSTMSAEERDQAETDFRVAAANHEQAVLEAETALATVRQRQSVLDTARQKLRETRIVAPDLSAARRPPAGAGSTAAAVEYVVAERLVAEGEMVTLFPQVLLFRLVMDQPLKLKAAVPERCAGEVKVGQPVEVTVEAHPRDVFAGLVCRVGPTVDRTNRTFKVEILVPNEARRLRAGGFARASVQTHVDPAAPTVPEEALVAGAGVSKVFVVRDGRAFAVPVNPGERVNVAARGESPRWWVEVAGELPDDAVVVTTGQTRLADGTPVRVRSAQAH
jgi:multidrug efflux pump subunit AcrA (membrane-fusion protein)